MLSLISHPFFLLGFPHIDLNQTMTQEHPVNCVMGNMYAKINFYFLLKENVAKGEQSITLRNQGYLLITD